MRESPQGSYAEDGGLIRNLHGEHGPASQEARGDEGVDKVCHAVEVGSTTRSRCCLSIAFLSHSGPPRGCAIVAIGGAAAFRLDDGAITNHPSFDRHAPIISATKSTTMLKCESAVHRLLRSSSNLNQFSTIRFSIGGLSARLKAACGFPGLWIRPIVKSGCGVLRKWGAARIPSRCFCSKSFIDSCCSLFSFH